MTIKRTMKGEFTMYLIQDLNQTTLGLLRDLDAEPFAARLLAGAITINEYASFLVQTYLYVRHTRPLLRRAAQRLEGGTDRPALAELFQRKADEEDGHEQWALADLCAIGRSADEARRASPTSAVSAYIAWNSFTVEHGSPIAFLGTAYVLEALSTARAAETAKNLVAQSGIPGIERAVAFLRGHADADTEHVAQLGRCLVALAGSPSDQHDVLLSAMITRATYAKLLAGITTWRPQSAPSSASVPLGCERGARLDAELIEDPIKMRFYGRRRVT
jgi:pyrroloquinoline quinone (PQQ) biosynthesis protein C